MFLDWGACGSPGVATDSTEVLDLLEPRLSGDVSQEVVSTATVLSELGASVVVTALLNLLHDRRRASTPMGKGRQYQPCRVRCHNQSQLMTCL
ncbi:hypothetical protein GCM10009679_59570 [Saccharothrix algeriensis]|uniref:Uncharacterized protein n=1 Tax=Catellatospora bangladeshensis TaxID=310355 RepID=A0A8J3JSU4_9ACTN|nr:hypothetical protein Cba03nite_44980 [Catellatospora bangladeshensis]